MKNFRELEIWKLGLSISLDVYKLYAKMEKQDQWTLGSQMIRAAVSIPSNIAEGSSRTSEKDYNRFIEISLGSTFELLTQIMIAMELRIGDKEIIDRLFLDLTRESKMITSFSRILRENK